MTISDGEVELSHEALLREWPRYRAWLEEDRIGRRVHAHLTAAARDWDERGRDVADLYRGARLAAALEWRVGREHELNETERAFVEASRAAAGRTHRRLRVMLAGMAFLLALTVAGGVVALDQPSSARNEARVAEAQRLGVQALSEARLDRSLLLARQGVALDESVATRSYLFDALLRSPAAVRVIGGAGNPLTALDLSPDGRTLAVGDTAGNVVFLDAVTGRRVGGSYNVLAALGAISDVRFSPDGRHVGVAVGDGFVDILDARTHRYIRRLDVAPPSAQEYVNIPWALGPIAFSPDSREVWADVIHNQPQGSSGYLVHWDVRSGQRLGSPVQIDSTPLAALAGFTGHGAQLVTSSGAERSTIIRDAATLRPVRRLPGGSTRAALSPDGRVVALGDADGSVRLLDLRTGKPHVATDRHDAAVTDLRFAPDSRTLLTAGADGRVIEWNVADARRVETFTGHVGTVSRVTIAPDGQTAYSAGADGTVIAWDLAHNRRLDRPFSSPPRHAMVFPVDERGPNGPTVLSPSGIDVPVHELAIATTPDGGSFAVPDDSGYVDVYDSRTLRRSRRIPVSPGNQVSAVAIAPDGRTVAATTSDGHLQFGDLRGHRRLEPLLSGQPMVAGGFGGTWSLAFSGDGHWLATAGLGTSSSAPLQLWDVRRRQLANTSLVSAAYGIPTDVTLSPDGKTLAVAATDGMGNGSALLILSVPGLEQLTKIAAPAGASVKFSPDGRLLAFGDVQGRIWLYDTRTWRPRGRPLLAHTGVVATVNFSPDGQTLATTSDDGATRLWDLHSGRPIGTPLPGFAQRDVAAAFVDGGTHLVTLDDNGRGDLWDIQPQSWARRACEVAGRTLTRAEWNDALPERTYAPACAPR